MLAELKELYEKIQKLESFLLSDKIAALDVHRRTLLVLQRNAMEQYATILACRCRAEGMRETDIIDAKKINENR